MKQKFETYLNADEENWWVEGIYSEDFGVAQLLKKIISARSKGGIFIFIVISCEKD